MARPVWNIATLGDFLWKPSATQHPQMYSFESDSGFMLNEPRQMARFHDVTATYWIKTFAQREAFYAFFENDLHNGAHAFEKEDPDRGKTAIFQFTPAGIQKVITGPGVVGSDQSRLTLPLRMRT